MRGIEDLVIAAARLFQMAGLYVRERKDARGIRQKFPKSILLPVNIRKVSL
jgi:hypothetical protein